jgi:hypothetical protein
MRFAVLKHCEVVQRENCNVITAFWLSIFHTHLGPSIVCSSANMDVHTRFLLKHNFFAGKIGSLLDNRDYSRLEYKLLKNYIRA